MMVARVTIICAVVIVIDGVNVIPHGWGHMCTAEVDSDMLARYVENVTVSSHVIHIKCHVDGSRGDKLYFRSLRDQPSPALETMLFVEIRCSNQGVVSLPWPMKAPGVVGVIVSSCVMIDKYADFANPNISRIPDSLRVLEIRDSAWVSDDHSFDIITSSDGLASLTSDYDCGQDSTIEYLAISNVSYLVDPATEHTMAVTSEHTINSSPRQTSDPILGKPSTTSQQTSRTPPKNTSSDEEFMNLLQSLVSLNLECNFEKLKHIDESLPHVMPVHHFTLMVSGAKYPELRFMNYSFSGIRNFPEELRDFRINFPKLEFLDFTFNYLTEVGVSLHPRGVNGSFLTLDVRNNLISNISVENIIAWSMSEGVFVDIRENPIHCGCEMQKTIREIQSDAFFIGRLENYSYIQDMECFSPSELKGKRLSEATLLCGEENNVVDSSTDQTFGIVVGCTVAAVVVIIVVLLAAVLVTSRLGDKLLQKCAKDHSKPSPEKDAEAGTVHVKAKI